MLFKIEIYHLIWSVSYYAIFGFDLEVVLSIEIFHNWFYLANFFLSENFQALLVSEILPHIDNFRTINT